MKQTIILLFLTLSLITLNSCAQNKDIASIETQSHMFFSFLEKNNTDSAWNMICLLTRDKNEFYFNKITNISSCINQEQINRIECKLDSVLNLYTSSILIHCNKYDFVVTLYFSRYIDNSLVIVRVDYDKVLGEMKPSDGIPEPAIKQH